ncbi:MAG TPA: aminotransferase class V-fold PLP-dependent enzyme [Blastocatellia bacterium]|nr:aminotransferase class V-fold PLP-dependent enzyme [Blastocatellia bacterium]
MLTPAEIQNIRSRFPILRHKTYASSCSQGALSTGVEAALREYITSWHEYGTPWDRWVAKYEEARAAFAAFIGASPDEVAITSCASAAINSIASALRFDRRRKVVLGEFEFPTMGHVWLAQQSRGAAVEFLKAEGERLPTAAYESAVDGGTAIVPVTRICFTNGFRSDVQQITQIAHARGAYVLLDDYQDAGTRPIDVKALGVDFYVTGTLKYLLGPSGLAFLYVREEVISQLTPTTGGWFAQTDPFTFNPQVNEPSPTARRFQSGTPPIPNVYAALAGIRLLSETGPEKIAAHVAGLAQGCLKRARELGLSIKTPTESVGPLVVLRCKDADAMVRRLAERDIIASSRRDGLRLSWHCYNTAEDVERVMEAVAENITGMVRD